MSELTDQPRGENGHGPGEFSERDRLPAEPQVSAALNTPAVTFPSCTCHSLSIDSVHDLVWGLDTVMSWDKVLGPGNITSRRINRRQPAVGEIISVVNHDQVITIYFRGDPNDTTNMEVLTAEQATALVDRLEEEFGVLPEAEYFEYLGYLDDLDAEGQQL